MHHEQQVSQAAVYQTLSCVMTDIGDMCTVVCLSVGLCTAVDVLCLALASHQLLTYLV